MLILEIELDKKEQKGRSKCEKSNYFPFFLKSCFFGKNFIFFKNQFSFIFFRFFNLMSDKLQANKLTAKDKIY